jgi:hypothetical protein
VRVKAGNEAYERIVGCSSDDGNGVMMMTVGYEKYKPQREKCMYTAQYLSARLGGCGCIHDLREREPERVCVGASLSLFLSPNGRVHGWFVIRKVGVGGGAQMLRWTVCAAVKTACVPGALRVWSIPRHSSHLLPSASIIIMINTECIITEIYYLANDCRRRHPRRRR